MNSVKVVIEALITPYLFQNLMYLGLFDVYWLLFIRNDECNKNTSIYYQYLTKFLLVRSKLV